MPQVWILVLSSLVLKKTLLLSHPFWPGDLLFLVPFRRRRSSANTFLLSGKTPEATFFKPLMVDPFRWPWVKVTKLPKRNAINLVPTVKWEPLTQNFGEILEKKFCSDFYHKMSNPFSPVEHSICHVLGMVGANYVKQKGNESTGYYAD